MYVDTQVVLLDLIRKEGSPAFSRHLFIAGDGDRLHEELVVPVVTRPAHIALLRLLQDDLDLLTLARLERAIGRAHLELFWCCVHQLEGNIGLALICLRTLLDWLLPGM